MAVPADIRILLVGFGNMGRALVRGWLDAGISPGAIYVADESEQARADAESWGLQLTSAGAGNQPSTVDILMLAVKPQQIDATLEQYATMLSNRGVVLSIAAGKTIASLEAHAGEGRAVVRSMPNTPAAIGRGTTGLCANAAVSASQRDICGELLSAVGAVFWVEDESLLDAVTAVSGSGPAYVFHVIECLTAAGVRQGLPDSLAAELAINTVAGSGAYALASDTPVGKLREQVTSPGGTTAAALGVFMQNDALRQLFDEAVAAAAKRSAELSSE